MAEHTCSRAGHTNVSTTTESLHDHIGAYDLVWCTGMLMHLPANQRISFLEAIDRLVVPRGRVFVDFFTSWHLVGRHAFDRGSRVPMRIKGCAVQTLRRPRLTVKRFRREVATAGLSIKYGLDSHSYRQSREFGSLRLGLEAWQR